MAGNASAISIASNSLILLGHAPISSFTEPGAGAQAVSNLYRSSYLNLLSIHRWRFATKKMVLSRLVEKPLNNYLYQYQLPSDLVYLIKTERTQDYEVYEDKLYSNYSTVSVDYIYEVSESALPHYFIKAFEFYLASQLAIPVTANSTRMAEYSQLFETQLKRARFADSTQRPVDIRDQSEYVDVRL